MNKKKRNYAPLILLSPAILLVVVIIVWPISNALKASFFYDVRIDPANYRFIGLGNYIQVWNDPLFFASLKNTLKWVVVSVSMQFLLGLGIALILNRQFRLRGFFRSTALIPWITPSVLVGLMWVWMYDGNYGVLNDILKRVGIISHNVPWLSLASTSLPSQMVAMIWQGTPFFVIMLLAGLQTIPPELYEAADVDGASSIQRFWYITLPHLTEVILITTLLRIIWVSNNVEIIYVMTMGGPGTSSLTLPVYTFMVAQKALNFGYASALAVNWAIMLSVFLVLYVRLMSKFRGRVD